MLLPYAVAWAVFLLVPLYVWLRRGGGEEEDVVVHDDHGIGQADDTSCSPHAGPTTPISREESQELSGPLMERGGRGDGEDGSSQGNDEQIDHPLPSRRPCPLLEPTVSPDHPSIKREPVEPPAVDGESQSAAQPPQPTKPRKACLACKKTGRKLLRCSRCQKAWFCNRECQLTAVKQGHRGDQCQRSHQADVQMQPSSASDPTPESAQTEDLMAAFTRYQQLLQAGAELNVECTRASYLSSADMLEEAAAVAKTIGGAAGAGLSSSALRLQAHSMLRAGDVAGGARVACAAAASARAAGSRTLLVEALIVCGMVARSSPDEMACAEATCRARAEGAARTEEAVALPAELLVALEGVLPGGEGPPPDLSDEGVVQLPLSPEELSRLPLMYNQTAVAICDAALTSSVPSTAHDQRHTPSIEAQASARANLARSLFEFGLDHRRAKELMRASVALRRRILSERPDDLNARRSLGMALSNLGTCLASDDRAEQTEADECLREALELGDMSGDVSVLKGALINLVNRSGEGTGDAESEQLRSRLNTLYRKAGREVDTICAVCLEPLQGEATCSADASDDAETGTFSGSCIRVLGCGHQFHQGCIAAWRRQSAECPVCKSTGS